MSCDRQQVFTSNFNWVDFRIAVLFSIFIVFADSWRFYCDPTSATFLHPDVDWADLRIAALFGIFILHFALRWLKGNGSHKNVEVLLPTCCASDMPTDGDTISCVSSELVPLQASLAQQIARIPGEIRGKVVRPLKLCDLAALCTTCHSFQTQLWDLLDVWRSMATDLTISIDHGCCGREVREIFRRSLCRVDGGRLRTIPPHQYVAILEEATLMAHGLLPQDGKEAVEELCSIVERALHAHDPAQEAAVRAAEVFISSMHRSMATFTEPQLERIEYAYHSARQLHALMVCSMQQRSEDSVWESFWEDGPTQFDERANLHAEETHPFCT